MAYYEHIGGVLPKSISGINRLKVDDLEVMIISQAKFNKEKRVRQLNEDNEEQSV
jgi:hypothetical protein